MEKNIKQTEYKLLLGDIKYLLDKARTFAYKAVDNIRVQTYWQIGERIARDELKHKGRAAYSKKAIAKLAADLGFSRVVFYRILQFYKTYPIVSTVPRQLSWSHLVELLGISSKQERQFYEALAIKNIWSSRELREQIQNKIFLKKSKSLPMPMDITMASKTPDEIFKNSYNFEFLKLSPSYNEGDVEFALVQNFEKLLLEFGTDFSLAGRQKKLVIDGQIHAVDLEFYHRGIPCIVIVDLKIGKFKSEYVGQMNKYLNYYRENRKYNWEKDPIGLIICGEKGEEEVHYALGNLTNRIFVSEYKIKLPSEKEITYQLRKFKK